VAPTVGGVTTNDGKRIPANQKIGGGPSVLYDAVAVLPSVDGVKTLVTNGSATQFVTDAFGHCKIIAWVGAAMPLFEKAGIARELDQGCIELTAPKDVTAFLIACKKGRYWNREKVLTF